MVAPLRPIAAVTRGHGVTQLYRVLGGAPAPLVRGGYQLAGIDKYLMKPWTIASNLDDRDLLAQIEAVDAFMARMHAYPGRTFGQLYHRFFRTNDLAQGSLALTGRTIHLADVTRRRCSPSPGSATGSRRSRPATTSASSSRTPPRWTSKRRRAATSACSRAARRAARPGRCWTGISTDDGYSAPDAPVPRLRFRLHDAARVPPPSAQSPEPVIRPGVTVAGLDVGGQTLSQAAGTIDRAYRHQLVTRNVSVRVGGKGYGLATKKVGFVFDPAKSARRAYIAGNDTPAPKPVDVLPWTSYDKKKLAALRRARGPPARASRRSTPPCGSRSSTSSSASSKSGRELDEKASRRR